MNDEGEAPPFRYLLTMLTNGRRECFERTLAAFTQHVTPRPVEAYVMDDGGQTNPADLVAGSPWPWHLDSSVKPQGMCTAHKNCWDFAAASDYDWVFHIEDDQVILRPTHLPNIAQVLLLERHVAQMALVRCPWGAEIEHGGYIPQFPGYYTRKTGHGREWIETTRNYATSPALCRTDLMREFPWPAKTGCETTIGPQIIEKYPDAVFGLWGGGEPHCSHIGIDRAAEAHGY